MPNTTQPQPPSETQPDHDDGMTPPDRVGPASARWTHIALRVADIDATIDWYTRFTPLELLSRRQDDAGHGAWLGHRDQAEHPFVLVIAQFFAHSDPYAEHPMTALAPFNHFGIEMPTRADVDDVAARGEAEGCLTYPATMMPPPIGYICMLSDPDGNMIEFSWDQGVYEAARSDWA